MKVVFVALLKLVGLVLMFGVIVLCSPVNRVHNSGNIKTRGKFDYSKLALIVHSNSSSHETSTPTVITSTDVTTEVNGSGQDDVGDEFEILNDENSTESVNDSNVTTTESEIDDNFDGISVDENAASTASSSSEKNVEGFNVFRSSSEKTTTINSIYSASVPRIGEDNSSTKELTDSVKKDSNATTIGQSDNIGSNEEVTKTKSIFSFVSLQQSLGEPPNFSKIFPFLSTNTDKNLSSFQTNITSSKQGNNDTSSSDGPHPLPNEKDASISSFINIPTMIQSYNPSFPLFPFQMFPSPIQLSRPENVFPFPYDGKMNFNVPFEHQDFVKHITDTIESINEDGTFHFMKHFNDGSSEKVEGYFEEVNGDTVFYTKGHYTINLPNGETSSVSYVIDDKGCITWLM